MRKTSKMSVARQTAYLAAFTAGAILFSYAETYLSAAVIPIPGVRLGLANIMILSVLCAFGLKQAILVSLARTLVVSLLFSSLTSAVFSICGSLLSILVMFLLYRCKIFSLYGISVAGAVMHNIGQLLAAAVVTGSFSIFSYTPYLMLCAVITGIVIALLTNTVLTALQKIWKNERPEW